MLVNFQDKRHNAVDEALLVFLESENLFFESVFGYKAIDEDGVVLADAVRTTSCPVMEVHISNLFGREQYRRTSPLAGACRGLIAGLGLESYRLAVEFFRKEFSKKNQPL